MNEEMNNVMVAILDFKDRCRAENIDEDSMETILLDIILSTGIEFSR